MQITSDFQMNRIHPAHIGNKPLAGELKSNLEQSIKLGANDEPKKKSTFETYLLDAVNAMNNQQLNVAKLEEQVLVDPESVDPQDVTIAMAKAQMSLDLAQTVISRLVNGWTELSQNR